VTCETLEEVINCFETGTLLRHTGSTLMNEQSSRSHSVFTISIEQRWSTDNNKQQPLRESSMYEINGQNDNSSYYLGAKFHFVDLAGSERVHRTGNVGERFKESVHINSGLLALGNVIQALSSNNDSSKRKVNHIPYRESKITRILKDSLGGNANTLMICCISPSSCNLDESLNAVKYASRARNIKNKPIVNMDPQTQRFVEMQSEIQQLREELQKQRTALLSATMITNQNRGGFNSTRATTAAPATPRDQKIDELEVRLQSTQTELDHYKNLTKEANARFKKIQSPLATEWIALFDKTADKTNMSMSNHSQHDDENSESFQKKINQLEIQLKQAIDDLQSDEEIFTDKEREISMLKERIIELESNLKISNNFVEEAYKSKREQEQLMLQLQMKVDQLMQSTNNTSLIMKEDTQINKNLVEHSNNDINKKRAATAPNGPSNDSNKPTNDINNRRGVFSSPALFTLERVMQSFRARSQILMETLEENDNILMKKSKKYHKSTGDLNNKQNRIINEEGEEEEEDDDDDDDEDNSDTETDDNNKSSFKRRGTFTKEDKIKLKNDNKSEQTTKKLDISKKSSNTLNKGSLYSMDAQQKKLRDLSINVKMKEELIKELVANSKFTNRLNLQYQHQIGILKKEIERLKVELDQNSQTAVAPSTTATTVRERDPSSGGNQYGHVQTKTEM
jgi:kinesin family member 27